MVSSVIKPLRGQVPRGKRRRVHAGMVTNDQEREDESATASDGYVNPRLLKGVQEEVEEEEGDEGQKIGRHST